MKLKKFDSINVIPFIDIMLVLLAIVLTTATFIAQGAIKVSLPQAESTVQDTPKERQFIITIDSQNRIFFADTEVIFVKLLMELDELKPADQIRLRVDEKANFGTFIKVVDELKTRSLENISIGTIKPE